MRVLVTGAGGQLGFALVRALDAHEGTFLTHEDLDVTDARAVEDAVQDLKPNAVIQAAAWTDVDGCEADPERARRVHAEATGWAAAAARDVGAFFVYPSTDYVFDGTLGRAYVEEDEPNPLQVYGTSKREGELAAEASGASVAVVRSAWLYGARTASGAPARNFVRSIVVKAAHGPLAVVDDQVGSPTAVQDLAAALAVLIDDPRAGVFHVVNAGAVSRYEFARAVVAEAGMDPGLVHPIPTTQAPPVPARRPAHAPLEGRAWHAAGFPLLPDWEDALARALPEILAATR